MILAEERIFNFDEPAMMGFLDSFGKLIEAITVVVLMHNIRLEQFVYKLAHFHL